ncbi:MAG: hypothetical protein ACOCWQ_06395 [Nanoarchaeota archaeon]
MSMTEEQIQIRSLAYAVRDDVKKYTAGIGNWQPEAVHFARFLHAQGCRVFPVEDAAGYTRLITTPKMYGRIQRTMRKGKFDLLGGLEYHACRGHLDYESTDGQKVVYVLPRSAFSRMRDVALQRRITASPQQQDEVRRYVA